MKSIMVIKEKDGVRGLVPSRGYGIRDQVYNSYLTTLNPRENADVQKALASTKDPRFQALLERINSPRHKRISLASIAKACNIDLKEFQDWWQKASTSAAIAAAQVGSVQVARDMVEDAKSIDDVCTRCDGLGFVGAPAGLPDTVAGYRMVDGGEEPKFIRTCPKCEGKAKVRKPGDSHARDKVMEMSGIIKKGSAAVSIVQNFGGVGHTSAITDLDSAMAIDVDSEPVGEV